MQLVSALAVGAELVSALRGAGKLLSYNDASGRYRPPAREAVRLASSSFVTTPPRRRPIRLHESVYATEGITFSVTVGTRRRGPVFADVALGTACVDVLRDLRASTGTRVYAYCLMPDHVHLLLAASARVSVPTLVQRWKSLCYREAVKHGGGPVSLWQRSFWDHGLRADEDLLLAARYILGNPVRAGLVEVWRDYPLCGSMEWDL